VHAPAFASEYEPAVHGVHDAEFAAAYVPAEHCVIELPAHLEPAGHGRHADAPTAVE
jgi:hypothetical protein